MDHYFYEGEGGGGCWIGLLPQNSCTAKTAEKKNVQGEPWGEICPASALCYPGPEFEYKENLAQVIAHKKNFMHNVNLQVRKKFFMLQKIAYPSPDPPPTHPSHLKKN